MSFYIAGWAMTFGKAVSDSDSENEPSVMYLNWTFGVSMIE